MGTDLEKIFADMNAKLHQSKKGTKVAGGCKDCNAYTIYHQVTPQITDGYIYHDDSCPFYQSLP